MDPADRLLRHESGFPDVDISGGRFLVSGSPYALTTRQITSTMVTNEAAAYTFNSKTEIPAHRFAHPPTPGFLSIIIPVYQDVDGLRDTLQTLARQTLPTSGFEVIVANDGGGEDIHQLCVEFGTVEIVLRPNQGAYVARNAALTQSRGEYIAFTDADVILDPDWCRYGVESMTKYHLVAGLTQWVTSRPLDSCQLFQLANYFPSENLIKGRMAQTVNTFIRREVFESKTWFDERLRSGGDIEFTQRAGMDPSLTFGYDPRIKAKHPVRTHAQLISSLKRIIFGQMNLYHLIPSRRRVLAPQICETYRLLLPPLKIYSTDLSYLNLSWKDHIAFYFFCWWGVKLRMFILVVDAWRHWLFRRPAKT
jgi:glycosyltransferase involved in cell wall biosynthesis